MATTGAVTLLDELSLSMPKIRAGVIKTLIEQVMLQDRIPWQTTGSKQTTVTFLSDVPTVQLRFLNEAVNTRKAEFAQLTETLTILETDIDIDPVFLDESQHIQNIQVAQTENVIAAIGYRINNLFINGDPTADAREPSGLKYKLTNDTRFTGQSVNATTSTTKLPFQPGTATDAQILQALNGLDKTLYLLSNGAALTGITFLVNQQTLLAYWANLRQIKQLDTTRDNFDREIPAYKGVPLIDVGYDEVGAITATPAAAGSDGDQIIGNDNDSPTGSGANAYTGTTPIYAVRFGDNYCVGLQQTPMKVEPFGKTDASPHYIRTNVRWVINPCATYQKRAIARFVGLDVS